MAGSPKNPIIHTWEGPSFSRRRSLPELLAFRQACGKPSKSRVGNLSQRGIPFNLLSSRGAWNTKRMQNMILVVGPNTPASLLMGSHGSTPSLSSSSESSSASDASAIDQIQEETQDGPNENMPMEEEEVVVERSRPTGRSRWVRQPAPLPHRDDVDDSDALDDDDGRADHQAFHQAYENALMEYYHTDESEAEDDANINTNMSPPKPVPSLRHGGCINTAAWLNCGWRLSTIGLSREAKSTEECTTQIVTSGDDLLVKFWDVSHAMGTTSPLAGSYATICPFSAPDASRNVDSIRSKWKRYYSETESDMIAGSVLPLATLSTGHLNNVFHVTPLRGQPGKVATCAADGFLRLMDLESGNSRIVVSPEFEDDGVALFRAGLMSLRSAMCFSHHFLSQNTGLLCCERGLRRFDLRLPPREQPTRSLLGGRYKGCKSCAVWSASKSTTSLEEGDSAYIFAGGSSAEVALFDLRMTDRSTAKVIQKYCPRNLAMVDMVSVSGIDVSRDGQELLISYESDQIYTFPIFPRTSSSAGPSVDEISHLTDGQQTEVLNELACYGGHLNRFTFLKNAKYAGPRDEYICTGSDSGRAWIYEKATGSVVSFLNADQSTCNGVIPHPTLPFFITYGIDSTAKLWRATIPVDSNVDDSAEGRRKCLSKTQYEMSPLIRDWDSVQKDLNKLDSEDIKEITDVFPDQIPDQRGLRYRGRFRSRLLSSESADSPRLGNDLHNLTGVLLTNFYDCIHGLFRDDLPVESGVRALKDRTSLLRLRHQADTLGLRWNPSCPWQLRSSEKSLQAGISKATDIHPADLVPDFPSDWVPYDPKMSETPWNFESFFNTKEYNDFYAEHYSSLFYDEQTSNFVPDVDVDPENEEASKTSEKTVDLGNDDASEKVVSSSDDGYISTNHQDSPKKWKETIVNNFYETIKCLKDAGNLALLEENFDLAARRYDKAIRYGAMATMSFPSKNLRRTMVGGYYLEWDPLLRVFLATRLNLALLLLKPYFSKYEEAAEQAQRALHDLSPFCVTIGMIMKGSKLDKVHREDEPEQTYLDAMALQAKAFFRLGSAQYELGDYGAAISCYEKSVRSTQLARAKPDNVVIRRLTEAKRENRRLIVRHRKKFKFAFLTNDNDEDDKTGCTTTSEKND